MQDVHGQFLDDAASGVSREEKSGFGYYQADSNFVNETNQEGNF